MSTDHVRNGGVDEERVARIVVVGSNLIRIALFLAAWELLRSQIRDKARHHSVEWGLGKYLGKPWRTPGAQRDGFLTALRRLSDIGALDDFEIAQIHQIHTCRNEVSEELPKLLFDPNYDFDLRHIVELRNLAFRLDECEQDIIDAQELGPDSLGQPSRVALLMDLLLDLAQGAAAKVADSHSRGPAGLGARKRMPM